MATIPGTSAVSGMTLLSMAKDSNGKTNFDLWVGCLFAKLGPKYPNSGKVLEEPYHVAYVVPQITEDEYDPPGCPVPLTEAVKRDMWVSADKARKKRVQAINDEKAEIFNFMILTLSQESLIALRVNKIYLEGFTVPAQGDKPAVVTPPCKDSKDSDVLFGILRSLHVNDAGGGAVRVAFNRQKQIDDIEELKQQPDELVASFYGKWSKGNATLVTLKHPVGTEAEQVTKFFRRVDQHRHKTLLASILNGTTPNPLTVHAAYLLCQDWVVEDPGTSASDSRTHVFITSDQLIQRQPPQGKPSGVDPARLAAAQKALIETAGQNGRGKHRERKPSAAAVVPPVKDTVVESKKQAFIAAALLKAKQARKVQSLADVECWHCHEKGHRLPNCPQIEREMCLMTALDLADGEEASDYDSTDGFVLVSGRDGFAPELVETTFVLNTNFRSCEVLFDSAAGDHVFAYAELLDNVRNSQRALHMHGIGGNALVVTQEGDFGGFGVVRYSPGAIANVLSQAKLKDAGFHVEYSDDRDEFYVSTGGDLWWTFKRKLQADRKTLSRFYTLDLQQTASSVPVLVETVSDNMRRYTVRELERVERAKQLMSRLGNFTAQNTIELLNSGALLNTDLTASDVRNCIQVHGVSAAASRGKTKRMTSEPGNQVLAPRVTQVDQLLSVDLFFVKKLAFILGILGPLGLCMCMHLKDRSAETVAVCLRTILSVAASRDYRVREIRTDGEGAIAVMVPELQLRGITVDTAAPGAHVPVVERANQAIKETVRSYDASLPYTMPKLMLIFCVLCAAVYHSWRPSTTATDKMSPYTQFSGVKLDAKKHLKAGFGDMVHATVPVTDNTMASRTQTCVVLMPTCNQTGSFKMWNLSTNKVVTRDQFKVVPMTDFVVDYISNLAAKQGYVRGFDPTIEPSSVVDDAIDMAEESFVGMPSMMPIERVGVAAEGLPTAAEVLAESAAGVIGQLRGQGVRELAPTVVYSAEDHRRAIWGDDPHPLLADAPSVNATESAPQPLVDGVLGNYGVRWSSRLINNQSVAVLFSVDDAVSAEFEKQLAGRAHWHDQTFAFNISVRQAVKQRGAEAAPVICAELQQMLDKGVWHGVHLSQLTSEQRRAIIHSTMFLKDKYSASGEFEKFKARLVARGDEQDKSLYDNLSSPTAATASVLTVAAIAASEGRHVIVVDIGGAFLNASMALSGEIVHLQLDRVMSAMLCKLDKTYVQFVDSRSGTLVVALDKALYGCVQAAALWYADLRLKLEADGFVSNPYDVCVFNKTCESGVQTTIVLHVDDLMVTSESASDLEAFTQYLDSVYPETTVKRGRVLDYLGMTFNFTVAGQVSVTMENCVKDILSSSKITSTKSTPASEDLFDIREGAASASVEESKYFHSHVAKMLYLAKRVRPECLTAVSFLSTRVQCCDEDDMRKLRRLLGYLLRTKERGIVLRIGEHMTVKAYIDAAYGVHQSSGKSHTGCAIVLGDGGPLYAKSGKQKIVTKSSTEAELVGLSDTASQALHLRNFVIAQGYDVGPAILYQDNLSCMALMKRGGPGSERSRHINIRHFWLAEKVTEGEVVIEHLGTENMMANVLTKPVQGKQFMRERQGLTNWK